ncbi:MAG TPA: hypothetical protein PKC28_12440, partial [Bdellovibrionales bacterium]|nr:hypothetical protein [Bdellovibrionales bacterium]
EETRAFEFEEPAREINLDSDIESLNAREDAEAGIEPPVESPGALEYDFGDEATADPAPPPYQSASSLSSPDLSDVARFGNSDISGGRDGTLRYKVTVEGVDTSDVRMAFREALTDRKFVWDIDQILRSMRHGQVTIDNVTPSKAFMLISRLRNLPVRVTWEQYAVHQT